MNITILLNPIYTIWANQYISVHYVLKIIILGVVELEELVGDFSFQVCVAMPRVRRNVFAYQDCEAALIDRFADHYGSAPLWNKQYETRRFPYQYNERQMDQALCKRSGAKYKWAVAPMKSSGFYENFVRTHLF